MLHSTQCKEQNGQYCQEKPWNDTPSWYEPRIASGIAPFIAFNIVSRDRTAFFAECFAVAMRPVLETPDHWSVVALPATFGESRRFLDERRNGRCSAVSRL